MAVEINLKIEKSTLKSNLSMIYGEALEAHQVHHIQGCQFYLSDMSVRDVGPTKHCPRQPGNNKITARENRMTARDCLFINHEILLMLELLLIILCYTECVETIK